MNPAGRRVLLTGASGGIGVEILKRLLRQGARVAAVSNNNGLDRTQLGVLAQDARRLLLIEGDLTDASFRAVAVAEVAQWGDGLDILINAAGASDFALFEHQAPSGIEFLAQLNLVAPMVLTRLVLPLLAASPQALIVNLGSVFGAIGYPGNAVYCATKFGLRGFSEALRRELADTAIEVLYVAPRATLTSLNPPAVNELNEKLGNRVDSATSVAGLVLQAINGSRGEVTFGWPEKLFVRVNSLLPRLVDSAIGSRLAVIKKFAKRNKGRE